MAKTKFWNPDNKLNMNEEPSLDTPISEEAFAEKGKSFSFGHAALKVSAGVVVVAVLVAFVGYLFVVRPATKVLSVVGALKNDASRVSDGFIQRDLVEVSEALDVLETDLIALRDSRDENLAWVEKIGFTRLYFNWIYSPLFRGF